MSNNDSVINFVFCEENMVVNSQDNTSYSPFAYEILGTNIPIILVTKIAVFEKHLKRYNKEQQITLWVHHQADIKETDKFGRYKGEEIGSQLLSKYPKLKFKYLTRAPHPDKLSNDSNKTPIVFINDLFVQIELSENYQKISDFIQDEPSKIKNNRPSTASGGKVF